MSTLRNFLAVTALALLPAAAFAQAPVPAVDDKSDKVVVVEQKGEGKEEKGGGGGKKRAKCNPTPTSPSILGPTGYILTPNAEIAGGGETNFAMAFGYDLVDNDSAFSGPNVNYYKVNMGLFKHLEVGGTFTHINGFGTFDTAYLNAKANILKPCGPFQLAGGVIDGFDTANIGGLDLRTEYVVGTLEVGRWVKMFPTLRVGAGWQTNTPIGVLPVAAPDDSIFVNGGLMIGQYLEIVGEWIDVQNNANISFTNLGGRLHIGNFEVHGYVLDVFEDALVGNIIPVYGASYTFKGKGGKKHKGGGGKGEPEMKGEPKGKEEVIPVPSSSNGLRTRLAAKLMAPH
jgi:hypothetical protein